MKKELTHFKNIVRIWNNMQITFQLDSRLWWTVERQYSSQKSPVQQPSTCHKQGKSRKFRKIKSEMLNFTSYPLVKSKLKLAFAIAKLPFHSSMKLTHTFDLKPGSNNTKFLPLFFFAFSNEEDVCPAGLCSLIRLPEVDRDPSRAPRSCNFLFVVC